MDIQGVEKFLGRKILPEYQVKYERTIKDNGYILTRPSGYDNGWVAINMMIHVNDEGVITRIEGDRCTSAPHSIYSSGGHARDTKFNHSDMAYLRRFHRSITEEAKEI